MGETPVVWQDEQQTIVECTGQDSGRVNMISTIGDTGITKVTCKNKRGARELYREVEKPNINLFYNKNMGGVDTFDRLCSSYPFDRRNYKWYHTLWHFIIEIALVNGRIVHNLQNPDKKDKLSAIRFREKVVNGLLDGYSRNIIIRGRGRKRTLPLENRLSERHFVSKYDNEKHRPDCVVCSIRSQLCSKKGKGDSTCKRVQTRYHCAVCEVPLCVLKCFEAYHTVKRFRKERVCSK